MNKPTTQGGDTWEAQIKKNTVSLAYWTGAWLVSMALAAFGPKLLWDQDTVFTVLAIGVNLVVGIGMILANKRHLQGLDELQKKVTLEAMALALGVGLVGGLSYSLLDTSNIISSHAQISHLVILISLTYLAGIIVGNRRYR